MVLSGTWAGKYLKQVLNHTDACLEIVRIEPSQLHILLEVWLILFLGSSEYILIIGSLFTIQKVGLCSLSLFAYSAQVLHFDLNQNLE